MSLVAFPTPIASPARKRYAWLALPAIALIAAVVYAVAFRGQSATTSTSPAGQLFTVAALGVAVQGKHGGQTARAGVGLGGTASVQYQGANDNPDVAATGDHGVDLKLRWEWTE